MNKIREPDLFNDVLSLSTAVGVCDTFSSSHMSRRSQRLSLAVAEKEKKRDSEGPEGKAP